MAAQATSHRPAANVLEFLLCNNSPYGTAEIILERLMGDDVRALRLSSTALAHSNLLKDLLTNPGPGPPPPLPVKTLWPACWHPVGKRPCMQNRRHNLYVQRCDLHLIFPPRLQESYACEAHARHDAEGRAFSAPRESTLVRGNGEFCARCLTALAQERKDMQAWQRGLARAGKPLPRLAVQRTTPDDPDCFCECEARWETLETGWCCTACVQHERNALDWAAYTLSDEFLGRRYPGEYHCRRCRCRLERAEITERIDTPWCMLCRADRRGAAPQSELFFDIRGYR